MPITKASDIGDGDALRVVQDLVAAQGIGEASRWDVATVLAGRAHLLGKPEMFETLTTAEEKITLAKLRKLTRRGLLTGCYCGCRGNFTTTPLGEQLLASG